MTYSKKHEETLDPENWDTFRVLGHKMLDDMINYLETVGQKQHRLATKEEISAIKKPLSREGVGEEQAYSEFVESMMPSMIAQKSARWWGWVVGGGSPYGMLTSMLTGGLNLPSDDSFSAAYNVNRQALDWVKEMLNYPKDSSGIFVTGGSEANFTGLAVARNTMAEVDMKTAGVQGVPHKMTVYVSEEGHHCLERSIELLGLGKDTLHWIPTDDQYRIRLDLLRESIDTDRRNGFHPFCVIGCAGTVNTGAFDDLNALADIAAKERMWLHVDGAFGSWVKISETHKHLADGLERADSLAVDLHKWMSMPYGLGCTLTRHPREHLKTFVYGEEAAYVKYDLDKPIEELLGTSMFMGLRLCNETLPLKVYLLLRAYGSERFGRVVQQNLDQIKYLEGLIRKDPSFEISAPVSSNIVCFRYKPTGLSADKVDELNRLIFQGSLEKTPGIISDTTIKGRYTLRACNVNHRSKMEDFDWLVAEVKRIGEGLVSRM